MQELFSSKVRCEWAAPNFIQELDVRTRMIFCLLASGAVIFIKDGYSLAVLAAASFVYAAAHKRFGVLLAVYAALCLMCLIALVCVRVMLWVMPEMGAMGMGVFLNPFLRMVILVHVVLGLALTSRVQEVLSVLKALHLPLFIYLPATVMIRFIPSFIHDIRLIRENLKIKGYALNPLTLTLRPALTLRLLFAPVAVRALRSSDELSIAAELKGIGYAGKMTFIKGRRLRPADYLAAAYALVLVAAAI